MLVLLHMTSTLVKYRGQYSDFNRPFNFLSAYFRCFLSGRNHRHFQQPQSVGEGPICVTMMSEMSGLGKWNSCGGSHKCEQFSVFLLQPDSRLDIFYVALLRAMGRETYQQSGPWFYLGEGQSFSLRNFVQIMSGSHPATQPVCTEGTVLLEDKLMDRNSKLGNLSSFPSKPYV
jgi:hypothetical protein